MSKLSSAAAGEPRLAPLALALCLAGAQAWAQEAGSSRSGTLVPTFSAEESLVDIRYRPGGGNGLESLTRVSPGVQYDIRSGRLQGALDYTANLIYRSGRGDPSSTELQNSLASRFIAEVVTNHAFIEAQATISQQTLSAFGEQTAGNDLQKNANRSEVFTASLSPSLRGQIGTLAQYDVRLTVGGTLTKDSPADSQNSSLSVGVSSLGSSSLFGWTLSGTQQRVNYRGPARGLNERVAATGVFRPLAELQFDAKLGREVQDDANSEKLFQNNYGGGLKWRPSSRARFELEAEKRYFGKSGHMLLEYRLPRTALSYNFTRDSTNSSSANGVGQPQTRYDQLYALEASAIPDPELRRAQVLAELAAAGLDPNAVVGGGFVTSVQSLQQRQDLSLVLQGLRSTLSLQAFGSWTRTLSTGGADDPLAGETVVQHGYTGTITHRLTPQSSLTLLGSRLMTLGTSTRAGTDLMSASVSLTSQLGLRTSTQVGARYSVFRSPTDPYHEAAVTGSLSLRF